MVVYCDVHNRIEMPDGKYVWLSQVVRLPVGVRLQDTGVQVRFVSCDYCKEEQGRLFSEEE